MVASAVGWQANRKERCWLCGYGRTEKANAGL